MKVTLELGGKAANIVFDDAPPIDQAIEGIVNGIFFNQGHVCGAGSRLLVQENVHDEVVDRLKSRLSTLRLATRWTRTPTSRPINSRGAAGPHPRASRATARPRAPSVGRGLRHPGQRLLVRPNDLHERAGQPPHRPRGGVRPRAVRPHLPHPGRGDREGEQHPYGLSAGIWTDKGTKILAVANRLVRASSGPTR